MTRDDLLIVAKDGEIRERSYSRQPTTDFIAGFARAEHDRFAIQLVGEYFEVYDLRTLRKQVGAWTIGMPKFSHKDEDRAVAWAIGEAWSEV